MKFSRLLVLMFYALSVAWVQGLTTLTPGNSLSADKVDDLLISPNATFSSGFYKVGTNAYCYAIWFTNSVNKTVAWMANRDHPVNGKHSKLQLQTNGNLVLTQADGSIVWSSGTSSKADVEARLLETGNLVLVEKTSPETVIWESFNFPTDTLLPTQAIVRNTALASMKSRGTYFSGYYNLKFDDNNVLNLVYNGPLVSSIYWPVTKESVFFYGRTPYNSSRKAILSDAGGFISSDNLMFNASDYGLGPRRRLTLDYDGILRVYSLDESTGLWEITWWPSDLDTCRVHGMCGPFGICSYNPMPACSCPRGFHRKDPSDWVQGCLPEFNLTCNPTDQWGFISYRDTDYYGYDLDYGTEMSLESCKDVCLGDCSCQGFGYSNDGEGQCFLKSSLLNGYQWSMRVMYIKVPRRMVSYQEEQRLATTSYLNCSDTEMLSIPGDAGGRRDKKGNDYMKYLISFIGSFAVVEVVCIGLGWWFLFRKHPNEDLENMGYIVLAMGFKRFTFGELKRATQNFKHEIGKGGSGTVYRGVLDNQRVVAVKRLEGVSQGDAEFWAEVSIIGKLNHRNLVKMWGFCVEKEQKMLVYDFMENGSLDRILFSDSSSRTLSWEERYKIALGTAKGLSYIHEECLEWVLHCDVKPQNILLTDQLEPQLTDFGLSKLFRDNLDTGFSKIRGTRGYLAPEWMTNSNIDAKADVYSYGIVLLELLTGQSVSSFMLNECAEGNERNLLVQFVKQKSNQGSLGDVIDPGLNHEYDSKKLQKLVSVALLCVEDDRNTRPAMSKVVELLTGSDES